MKIAAKTQSLIVQAAEPRRTHDAIHLSAPSGQFCSLARFLISKLYRLEVVVHLRQPLNR